MKPNEPDSRWQPSWPDDPRSPHDWKVPSAKLGHSTDVMPADEDGMRRYRKANGYCDRAKDARIAAEDAYGPLA